MANMQTTIMLDKELKKDAQIKAINERKSLSGVINELLELYVYEDLPTKKVVLKDKPQIISKPMGKDITIDREFIYDLD